MARFSAKMLSSFLFVALTSTSAFAQQQSLKFQLDRFEPLPSQGTNTLNIAKSDVLPVGSPSAGFFINYAANGFQLTTDGSEKVLVESQLRSDLWFGIGVFDFFDLGFVLPLFLSQSGSDLGGVGFPGQATNDSPTVGDFRVVPKIRLLDGGESGIGLSILPTIGIPSGNVTLNTDGDVKFEPRAVLDWRSKGGFAVALNGAYLFRPQRVLANYVSDDVVRWGAGVEIPVLIPEFKVLLTGYGDIGLVKDQEDDLANPIETDAALQYMMGDFVMLLGGGAGLNQGVGNPEIRLFGAFGYTPMKSDSDNDGVPDKLDNCPKEAEDIDGFEDTDGCPDLDNDADGISDKDDMCTDEPEDIDGFEDDDGCPETDNDGDGIGDGQDKCPNEAGLPEDEGCPNTDKDKDGVANDVDKCPEKAEDKDGFEDADGCPDTDNDGDGILDADDKCPDKAEDKDGFEDADGCPDLDNDNDGIPDATDKCPNKAEVINGNKDEDGCPDRGKTKVLITKTSIKILDKVFFASGKAKIKKKSFNLLDQVASILKANPQINKIRVEGHTDDRGKDASNLKLSQARAESVVKYLVEKGLPESRLIAKGYGEVRPIASNKSRSGRASNRRVEFNIVELNGKPVQTKSVVIETRETVEEKAPEKLKKDAPKKLKKKETK